MVSQAGVHYQERLLQDVIAKRVQHQSLGQELQAGLSVLGLLAQTAIDRNVFILVRAAEELVHLRSDLIRVEAFLNHVGRELKLAQADKVLRDHSKNHVAFFCVFKFEYVLNQVIAERILNQGREVFDDHIG